MAARSDPFRQARTGRTRRAALLTAALLTAATLTAALATAAGAGPAMARTAQPVPSSRAGGGGAPGSTNDATQAHTAYLRANAPADHMGGSLAGHRASSVSRSAVPQLPPAAAPVYGDDVSSYQGDVNWSQVATEGGQFAYVKATEGTYYTNPYFARQYTGSRDAGLIRGAYAFAIPSYSSGTAQASYFAAHGGAWSADGHTLPGALDVEYNPYGPECYGLSTSAMVSWIGAFVSQYHALTGRWAVIYTTADWWSACTGGYGGFAANDPLWIANYASTAGVLPAGWSSFAFWQYAGSGALPGDQDAFNGTRSALLALAG